MSNKPTIYYYPSPFCSYNGTIYAREIPARSDDIFLYVSYMSSSGDMGFHRFNDSWGFIKDVLDSCITVDVSNKQIIMDNDENIFGKYGATHIFFPKNKIAREKFKEHEKYLLVLKKYAVYSRYRDICMPQESIISDFLRNGVFTCDFYNFMMENCFFIAKANHSGEHGSLSYELFTRDYEGFCRTISVLMGKKVSFVGVHSILEIPFY